MCVLLLVWLTSPRAGVDVGRKSSFLRPSVSIPFSAISPPLSCGRVSRGTLLDLARAKFHPLCIADLNIPTITKLVMHRLYRLSPVLHRKRRTCLLLFSILINSCCCTHDEAKICLGRQQRAPSGTKRQRPYLEVCRIEAAAITGAEACESLGSARFCVCVCVCDFVCLCYVPAVPRERTSLG